MPEDASMCSDLCRWRDVYVASHGCLLVRYRIYRIANLSDYVPSTKNSAARARRNQKDVVIKRIRNHFWDQLKHFLSKFHLPSFSSLCRW